MRRWLNVLTGAVESWVDDNAFQHSAAVSFYTLFSLAPVTLIAVGLGGLVLGREAAVGQLSAQMKQLLGAQGAQTILAILSTAEQVHHGWASAVLGALVLLIGATSVFSQLHDSLNAIWRVEARPHQNSLSLFLVQRLISIGMVLTVGFLLLVSLIVTTALQAMTRAAGGRMAVPPLVLEGLDLGIALAVITLLFAAIFRILPDVQLPWREVWGSALFTAALFSVGRFLIAIYLAHAAVASVFGAAGSLAALLVWVYYSCAILFLGVEFTRCNLAARGLSVQPKPTAVLIPPRRASSGGSA